MKVPGVVVLALVVVVGYVIYTGREAQAIDFVASLPAHLNDAVLWVQANWPQIPQR